MGANITSRRLGPAIDTESIDELLREFVNFIRNGVAPGFDPLEAKKFAEENTVHSFSKTIFKSIGLCGDGL